MGSNYFISDQLILDKLAWAQMKFLEDGIPYMWKVSSQDSSMLVYKQVLLHVFLNVTLLTFNECLQYRGI